MKITKVNPKVLGPAVGYSHGVRAGNMLFIAGQVGGAPKGDGSWRMAEGFTAQFAEALENIAEVLREEGASPERIVDVVVFVKDMDAYRASRKALGAVWKKVMGSHYPAITMVEVSDLFEPGCLVEIRAVAALE